MGIDDFNNKNSHDQRERNTIVTKEFVLQLWTVHLDNLIGVSFVPLLVKVSRLFSFLSVQIDFLLLF